MKVQIVIETANAAFDGAPEAEVARILADLAVKVAGYRLDVGDVDALLDRNGNRAGLMVVRK